MASKGSHLEREQSIICGFLRNMIKKEHDYSPIFAIVVSFYHQGFAKYFHQTIDKNYKQKMRFGDMLRANNDGFFVLDRNNRLTKVGRLYAAACIYVDIPFTICQHLDDAVSFYSKVLQIKTFTDIGDYTFNLGVKYDDEWILQQFDGPLDPKYKSIKILCTGGKFKYVKVRAFNEWKIFNTEKIKASDIIKYFELTKNPKNLVKLNVSLQNVFSSNGIYCKPVSVLWNQTECIMPKLEPIASYSLIGPKYEQNEMISKLEQFYKHKFDFVISIETPSEIGYWSDWSKIHFL